MRRMLGEVGSGRGLAQEGLESDANGWLGQWAEAHRHTVAGRGPRGETERRWGTGLVDPASTSFLLGLKGRQATGACEWQGHSQVTL